MSSFLKGVANAPREIAATIRRKPVQALVWFSCWSCWTLASMQYYALPFTISNLAKYLKVEQDKISYANTTSMLSRSVGAAIFGVLADQFGRKIPLLADLVLLGVFSMCSGFIHTYGQLIGVRVLFGVAYGGTYGLIMSSVLEAVPGRARGVVAGLTQQGFAAGYMLCSGLHLVMNQYGWRPLYWLLAGLTVPIFAIRLITPYYSVQSNAIKEAEGIDHVDPKTAVGGNLPFMSKLKYVLRNHYGPFIYACALTACFNTIGHGAMDLYPTFLLTDKKLSVKHETWVTVILQVGGVSGGTVGGYLSNKYSPKWVAFCCALLCAPWLPLWALPNQWNHLATGAFFLQFFYGCAIGNLGNILQQLCPHPGMRAAFTGVAYNIGNMISSIAPTIETKLGDDLPLPNGDPDYAKTQMILVGIVIGLLSFTLAIMPKSSLNKTWDTEDPNFSIPKHEAEARDVATELYLPDHTHVNVNADGTAENKTTTAHVEALEGNSSQGSKARSIDA